MRIVSLVPAATEIVFAIGAGDRLVGRSPDSDHPPEATTVPTVEAGMLAALAPDVVIVEDEATTVPAADVVTLAPRTLAQVADGIERIGRACRAEEGATRLRTDMAARFRQAAVPVPSPLRVVLLDGLDPPAFPGRWTPEVVAAAGCVAGGPPPGSPPAPATWDEVEALRADAIVLALRAFDLDRAHDEAAVHRQQLLRSAPRVLLADGDYFTRPGPRLVLATEGLAAWLIGRRPLPQGFAPLDWT